MINTARDFSAPLVCVGLGLVPTVLGLEIVGNGIVLLFGSVTVIDVTITVLESVTEVGVGMLPSPVESVGIVKVVAVSEGTEDVAMSEARVVPMPSHAATYSIWISSISRKALTFSVQQDAYHPRHSGLRSGHLPRR
jgi:hypothetical protein